jgi:hypothetical protein
MLAGKSLKRARPMPIGTMTMVVLIRGRAGVRAKGYCADSWTGLIFSGSGE